ncbi:MAG: nuclear transport factor 2 family protein [Blastocatellia bacterium]|nr:nuclear transport factor 2 family protein [Blastocatellia bacterium]
MKFPLFGLSLLLMLLPAFSDWGLGQKSPHKPNPLVSRLTSQADAWDKAIVHKDRSAIAANMSDAFRHIDSQGNVSAKQQFIDNLTAEKLQIDPYQVEDFEVRVYGTVALLTGTTKLTGRYDGKVFTTHYRYTDIYVKEAGGWKIVQVQITEIGGKP